MNKGFLRIWQTIILLFFLAGCTPAISPASVTATLQPTTTAIASATYTVEPTATIVLPTPTINSVPTWLVHAILLPDWPINDLVRWQNFHTLTAYAFGSYQQYNLQPNTRDEVTPVPQLVQELGIDPKSLYYSEKGTYVLACEGSKILLFTSADAHRLGEFSIEPYSGCVDVSWANDESSVAIVPGPHTVLIWKVNQPQPVVNQLYKFTGIRGAAGPISWSPNNQAVVIPTWTYYTDPSAVKIFQDDLWAYAIVYTDNRPLFISPINLGNARVRFLTNNILFWSYNNVSCGYAVANTGVLLDKSDSKYPPDQYSILSPNERWIVIDESRWISPDFSYKLYDFQTDNIYDLLTDSNTVLTFLGWSPDSQNFYVVSRPADLTAVPPVGSQFGLMRLDPATRQFTTLNPDILIASLSPDSQFLFGITPTDSGLAGAFYNTNGTPFTQPVMIHLKSIPETGASYFIPNWSNDGTQFVYFDADNNLWLVRADGKTQILAKNISFALDSGPIESVSWSPDNQMIFLKTTAGKVVLLPPIEPGKPVALSAIQMDNEENGSALTDGGHLLQTTNGGTTWQDVTPINSIASEHSWPGFDKATFLDAKTGWRMDSGQLQQSDDGGATWMKLAAVGWAHVQFSFVNEHVGWAIVRDGDYSALLKTYDGGRNWLEVKPTIVK